MAGRVRVSGLERVFVPSALACLMLGASACLDHSEASEALLGDSSGDGRGTASAGAVGSSSVAGAPGGIGAIGPSEPDFGSTGSTGPSGAIGSREPTGAMTGGIGATGSTGGFGNFFDACIDAPLLSDASFAEQMVDSKRVAHRELFSWITNAQAVSLRQERVLFGASDRADYPVRVFESIAQDSRAPERAELAKLLGGPLFKAGRSAWPEPWAIRLGAPGEEQGANLLRIVLKAEAWVVVVKAGDLRVYDLQNQPVSLTEALATPGRLGAIFYQKDAFAGGPLCDGAPILAGSGYREFMVGNLSMVEEWSLGTQAIRDRLTQNIARLSSFFERLRACPVTLSAAQWSQMAVCNWDRGRPTPVSEIFAYDQALATPSERYWAVPERIAALIETLKSDSFEIDPLVVTPGSP